MRGAKPADVGVHLGDVFYVAYGADMSIHMFLEVKTVFRDSIEVVEVLSEVVPGSVHGEIEKIRAGTHRIGLPETHPLCLIDGVPAIHTQFGDAVKVDREKFFVTSGDFLD